MIEWGALFTAGASLASSLLQMDAVDRQQEMQREENALQRDFLAQQGDLNRGIDRERIAAMLQNAQLQAGTQRDTTLAGLLARQGEQAADVMSADQLSYARRPERTNDAVSMLIASLRGGR